MQSQSEHIIRASGLGLDIGPATLLDEACLEARAGERIAIVGPNGAGKTTLIRCLLGLIRPDRGDIAIRGCPIAKLNRTGLARLVSYVPQQLPERISFTAAEFIAMSRFAHGNEAKPSTQTAVEHTMELTGTRHLADQPLSTMSGGERQQVSIAAALAQHSPVMILDEPSAHLDPRQRDLVHRLLQRVSEENRITLIVITHDLNWASSGFDRIIGMRQGQTLVDADPGAFMCGEVLQKIFNAGWLLHPHPESGRPMVLPGGSQQA